MATMGPFQGQGRVRGRWGGLNREAQEGGGAKIWLSGRTSVPRHGSPTLGRRRTLSLAPSSPISPAGACPGHGETPLLPRGELQPSPSLPSVCALQRAWLHRADFNPHACFERAFGGLSMLWSCCRSESRSLGHEPARNGSVGPCSSEGLPWPSAIPARLARSNTGLVCSCAFHSSCISRNWQVKFFTAGRP